MGGGGCGCGCGWVGRTASEAGETFEIQSGVHMEHIQALLRSSAHVKFWTHNQKLAHVEFWTHNQKVVNVEFCTHDQKVTHVQFWTYNQVAHAEFWSHNWRLHIYNSGLIIRRLQM